MRIARPLTSTSYTLNTGALPGTSQGLVRMLASDGFHTAQDQSNGTFSVARHAPSARIQAPVFNRVLREGLLTLEGSASDAEDGSLGDAALTWTSDRSGSLGAGAGLSFGVANLAAGYHVITLTARDSDNQTSTAATRVYVSNSPAPQPLNDTQFFVAQHYLDFLGRTPDADGLAFWTGDIEKCGADAQCREVKRINVSAAFFLSIEFQETGYLAYRAHKAAFGNLTGQPVPTRRRAPRRSGPSRKTRTSTPPRRTRLSC